MRLPSITFLLLSLIALPAQAATITVDTTADELDGGAPNGSCSLREAIVNINDGAQTNTDCPAGTAGDTIQLTAGQTYTITRAGANENAAATGDLDLLVNMSINGVGGGMATIDGGALDRVFHIGGAATVSMDSVKITNGIVDNLTGAPGGGGVYVGGTFTFTNGALTNNTVTAPANTVRGAAFYAATGSVVDFTDVMMSGNMTTGIGGRDGATCEGGSLTFNRVTMTGGTGQFCSLNVRNGATVSITNSSFSGNSCYVPGLYAVGGSNGTISNSTFSGNTGTYPGLLLAGGTFSLTNVTVANNTTTNFADVTADNSATVTLKNVTVAGGNKYAVGAERNGTIIVSDSIIRAATRSCYIASNGVITSNGYNLVGDTGCASLFNGVGDQNGVDPQLQALGNNGGTTQTMALPAGSPALDAGNCSGQTVTTDQRGTSRPQGTGCDIGSFEAAAFAVNVAVTGTGSVTDNGALAGFTINCGATCADSVFPNESVTLNATPGTGRTFLGWSGDCTGTGACVLSNIAAAKNVTATFDSPTPTPTPDPWQPDTSASTTSVDFGSVAVGASGSGTATISNNGVGSVAITGVSTPGSPFAIASDGCSGQALSGSGGSCGIDFTFTPTAAGSFSERVTVSTNAGPLTITLSGAATSSGGGGGLTPPTLLSPADGATLPAGSVTFEWEPGAGNDELLLCDNADFVGCASTDTARLDLPWQMIVVGLMIPFGLRSCAGRSVLLALLIVAGGVTACGSSSTTEPDSTTSTDSRTLSGGSYYWKVVTTNGAATGESEVRLLTIE